MNAIQEQRAQEQYSLEMEQRMTRVETLLQEIATNHLAHIQASLDNLKSAYGG